MVKKIGPYRVEERLGVGGMGEVYKAFDDRLDRWVAIKRIRPDKEGADDNRERFQREARATAKLNHSSIVHLYDIFQDGDSDCIVMEYVEGRTLDTMVMEGALPSTQAMQLGLEIASGLAEAHSKGIIHRDLKVENIIVTPEGHAKILDFGLAKPILSNELDTSLTGKGQLVGTSRAMSPEYVSGEEIDHRSDLFSLGVLLYEAATGHSPFKAHNTLATLKQVMLHSQTPAYQVNSKVPVELSELIDRLLEKDPEDRPQSAEEVVDTFRQLSASHLSSSSTVSRPLGPATGVYPAPSGTAFSASATAIEQLARRPFLWVLIPLLLATIGITIYFTTTGEPVVVDRTGESAPPEWNLVAKEIIVIGDFENKTGEPLLDDTLGFAFRLGLEQSRIAQALSPSQIEEALARMELDPETPIDREVGKEICQREGARALVIGSIVKIIDSYQLSGTILDPEGGTSFTRTFTASDSGEIVSALNGLIQEVRTNLGESLGSIDQANSLDRVTTRNLEALRAYSLGDARMAAGLFDEARPFFQRALEEDPEFAMAHGKLAALYILRRDYEQGLEHLDRALERTDRLTRYEALYLRGWEARLRKPPGEVVEIWASMSSLFPEVQVGHRNAGMAYFFLMNRFADAATYFERAVEVADPGSRNDAYQRLGQSQLALGDLDAALTSFRMSTSAVSQYLIVDHYLASDQRAEARETLESRRDIQSIEEQQFAEVRWAMLEADLGNLGQALDRARNAESLESRGDEYRLAVRLAVLALAEWSSELFDAELELSLEASIRAIENEEQRKLRETLGGLHELPLPAVATIGKICARSGSLEAAERLLERIRPLSMERGIPVWTSHVAMLEAEVSLQRGNPAVAIQHLDRALRAANFFQVHESQVRAYAAAGRLSEAAEEARWMLDHKGRGIVECSQGCQALNILDWHLAQLMLGQTLERLGRQEEAQPHLEAFDAWRSQAADAESSTESSTESPTEDSTLDPPPRLRELVASP